MTHVWRFLVNLFVGICLVPEIVSAAGVILVSPSQSSPQPIGAALQWSAISTDISGAVTYSWSVTTPDGISSVVSDFDPSPSFTYMPLQEGLYTVTVGAKNGTSLIAMGTASNSYIASSLLTGTSPVVTSTSNPFVAIYSALCSSGSLRVFFAPVGVTVRPATPPKPCYAGRSVNVLVAGMTANTHYIFQHQISNGFALTNGPLVDYATGPLPAFDFRNRLVTGVTTGVERTLLFSMIGVVGVYTPVAYDTDGSPTWYLPQPPGVYNYLFRPVKGGTFLLEETGNTRILEVDLLGNLVHQTTSYRVSEQLALQGIAFPVLNDFNHDAIRLPNGYTAILAGVEQFFPNGPDGSGSPVDLLGTAIIVLDANWRVAWTWNPYAKLDVTRMPVSTTYVCPALGCEPTTLYGSSVDWMHGNSLWLTDDGNLLLSMRSQDWIVKINYNNGLGNGDVMWRLGKDGDFTITNPQVDPYPWFSGQHFPNFQGNYLTVFDNGNMRVSPSAASTANSNLCCSRVQAWLINESAKTATLATNGSLSSYSFGVGDSQRLLSGNVNGVSGYQLGGSFPWITQSMEFSILGTPVYTFSIDNTAYRAFRMRDLYTP